MTLHTFLQTVFAIAGLLLVMLALASLIASWLKRPALVPVLAAPPLPRQCSNCKHFDLAEGQAVIAQFPAFMRVANVVSPAQIGRRVMREFDRPCRFCNGSGKQLRGGDGALEPCRGCEGTGKVHEQELSRPGAPEKARWEECGACLKDQVVVWGGDKKDCFEART